MNRIRCRHFGPAAALLLALLVPPSALFAGEGSWSHVPFDAPHPPSYLVPTGDPAIWYWADGWLARSTDGGLRFTKIEAPASSTGLTADPLDPARLFLLADGYLQRSTDGGEAWLPVLATGDNPLWQVLPSARQQGRVYALLGDRLLGSQDGGATFERRGDLPAAEAPFANLSEGPDGDLYLTRREFCGLHGCGHRVRAFRSADRGITWTGIYSSDNSDIFAFAVVPDPFRPQTVFLRETSEAGPRLWRSDDRGATFQLLGAAPEGQLFADPTRPGVLVALLTGSIAASLDGGLTWHPLELPFVFGERRAYFASGRLRLIEEPAAGQIAFADSADLGASWTRVPVARPMPGRLGRVCAGAAPGLFYGGVPFSPQLAVSTDGAATFALSELPPELELLAADPLEAATLYAWNRSENALYRSPDRGASFERVAPGWGAFLNDFAFFVYQGHTAIALVLDAGITVARDGVHFDEIRYPPGGGEPFGPEWRKVQADGGVLYAVTSHTDLFRSLDGGASWEYRATEHYEARAGGGILADLDPYRNVVEISADGGSTWQSRPLPFYPWNFFENGIAVDPFGALYLVHERHLVLRSRDRGRSWQALSSGLPEYLYPSFLAFDPADPDHLIFATTHGLYHGHFPNDPALSLFGGRFAARLRWSAGGATGEGVGAVLGDESGFFSLFTPERAEVYLRVADRRDENGHFEIALAALTDVGLELEVTDRFTGERYQRSLPPGAPAGFSDPQALPLLEAEPTGGRLPRLGVDLPSADPVVVLGGRFEISASAQLLGELRVAEGRSTLGDSAAFAILPGGPSEIFVNVVDGRPLNQKFWVFGSSFTAEPFTLTLRDQQSGETRVYHHPGGFPAFFSDLGAFP